MGIQAACGRYIDGRETVILSKKQEENMAVAVLDYFDKHVITDLSSRH